MSDDHHDLVLLIGGLWLVSKAMDLAEGVAARAAVAVPAAVKAVERGGARVYDAVHNDENHVKDLPLNPWKKAAIVALAKKNRFPDPNLAAAIAMAESGGVPNALTITDRENSVGLWQINLKAHPHYTRAAMIVPDNNAVAAFTISKGGTDWRPWSVYTSGKYKQFL
jgi:hypothetical protein